MIHTMSILDTDLYKFTTSYAYMKMFPDAICTFTFVDRNRRKRTEQFLAEFKKQMKLLQDIKLNDNEKEWCIKNIPFIPEYYWEWLKSFRFDYSKMNIYLDNEGILQVQVTDKCYRCSLYEIPVLYTVAEVQNRVDNNETNFDLILGRLKEKINFANTNNLKFSEFGTRRRFSYDVQDKVISYIKENSKTCVGTSNVYFAYKYNMKPIGTHPHEWFMFHGAQFGYKSANYMALENWVNVYDGNLGIALTDTYTSDVFFHDFSLKQAKLFDGIRQDSGDEYEFTDKAIEFYKSKGINPLSKTIIFSNALNFFKAKKIADYCNGKIGCSFGIGTNLTNDCNYPPENIVMKMTDCCMNKNKLWRSCIKISDDLGKHMGNNKEIEVAKYELGID